MHISPQQILSLKKDGLKWLSHYIYLLGWACGSEARGNTMITAQLFPLHRCGVFSGRWRFPTKDCCGIDVVVSMAQMK